MNGIFTDLIAVIVLILGLTFAVFNCFTIVVLAIGHNYRGRSNLPMCSFLAASALQSLLVAPLFTYKKLLENTNMPVVGVCDSFRVLHFACGHLMKLSLVLTSVDRLIAIRYPFVENTYYRKQILSAAILCMWIFVAVIDSVPFIPSMNHSRNELCTYNPAPVWGICLIVFFDILPFIIIVVNYTLLWRKASSMRLKDMVQMNCRKRLADIRSESAEQRSNLGEPLAFDCGEHFHDHCSYLQAIEYGENKRKRLPAKLKKMNSGDTTCHLFKRKIRFTLELKATKTSIFIVFMYLLCWGPAGVYYMLDHFCYHCLSGSNTHNHQQTSLLLKSLCFTSSIFAPVIYCWRTKDFWMEVFRLCCKKRFRKWNSRRSCVGRSSRSNTFLSIL